MSVGNATIRPRFGCRPASRTIESVFGGGPDLLAVGQFELLLRLQKGTEAACTTEEPERKAANPSYPNPDKPEPKSWTY